MLNKIIIGSLLAGVNYLDKEAFLEFAESKNLCFET